MMQRDDPQILQYESPTPPAAGWFPLGTLSLTLGHCVAIGIPTFDTITNVPGFVQGPIIVTGLVAAVLAIAFGIGAMFMAAHRRRGIIGTCLGCAALILLPLLARL